MGTKLESMKALVNRCEELNLSDDEVVSYFLGYALDMGIIDSKCLNGKLITESEAYGMVNDAVQTFTRGSQRYFDRMNRYLGDVGADYFFFCILNEFELEEVEKLGIEYRVYEEGEFDKLVIVKPADIKKYPFRIRSIWF